ncbi:recombination regulator RecX [Gracilibacillus timonensis]|uniref:recombination regulator RecX n=1 Tax=Gracilibacillus timonensis TaxID=1816696 RepID=UPI000824F6E4|nr:recombination regulator RecX [Gracilibacillus timonensis]
MPEIAKISAQKKRKDRYNIFFQENGQEYYGFSVGEDVLITYHLHKGLELTNETIEKIQEQDAAHKAYLFSIRYLSYRMRSEKEIADYLRKKEIDPDYIEEVITRLKKEQLLDDLAFSEALVTTRIQTSSKGPLMIKKELAEKGVAPTIIEQAITAYTFEEQTAKVEKWVNKQLKPSSKKSHQQQINSTTQSLLQKGFTQEVISVVLAQIADQRDQGEEYKAAVYQGEKLIAKFQKKESGYMLIQKVKAGLYRKGFPVDLIDRFIDEYIKE